MALHARVPRPDRRLIVAAVALVLSAAAVGGWVATRDDATPASAAPAATATASASPRSLDEGASGFVPARIAIDAIGVTAPVIGLGRAENGAQEVPEALDVTGWWQDGSTVGGQGSAAIVGHTSSTGGAVFDRLGELEPGDRVRVDGDDGERTDFVVRRVETVPVEDFAEVAARVYGGKGRGLLALMTCGDFDGSEFRSTVIAWATPVRS